ncbi:hypothetical protein HFO07_30505 [Rhizobium leguminosarum]|uniref:hypothetical protein n=1 Tax=Rhizobium leguminosarum TaxID=384 RepID=UPI001C9751DF|nr:hypothetical protein [Rhizobium leguminosarum]MBY5760927.1 hypothetical protein [Rhizobium leguminosarum]
MLLTPPSGGGSLPGVVAVTGFTMTEINAALASAGAGGTVYFPPGNYTVAGLTASYANQRWWCAPGAKFKKADSNTAAMIALAASGLVVDGGDWDANRTGAPAAAVFVDGTDMDFTMIGSTVHGGTSWGVAIDNGLVRVEDCYFYNFAYAVLIWRATNKLAGKYRVAPTVRGNRIDRQTGYTSSAGIIIRSVGTAGYHQGAQVENNRIWMPVSEVYDNVGVEITEGIKPRIEGNLVEGGRIAFSLGGAIGGTVIGNMANAVGDYVVELATACSNCAVTGNSGTGLFLGITGTGGCVITSGGNGNVVVGNRIGQGFPNVVYQDSSSAAASPSNLITSNA